MNLTPDSFGEICKQSAFISALVAGFSFAFLGVLLVSSAKKKVTDWIMAFSILSIAGLLICSLAWTLCASRMALLSGSNTNQVPQTILELHKSLSVIFISSFFFFLVTLGLSGWIRSRTLGLISTLISIAATLLFISIMRHFIL
jgi:hypothetical protein